jgi:hypothetical protein
MTETELLMWLYYRIKVEINAKQQKIEDLRQIQQETKAMMPRLYFVKGFGQEGLAKRIHFAGTEEECKAWVSQNANLEVMDNGVQIRNKNTPPVGTHLVAGLIDSVTPLDKDWHKISKMAELGQKKKGDASVNE